AGPFFSSTRHHRRRRRHHQRTRPTTGEGPDLLHPSPAGAGHPHATHQFGLTDIQCRYALEDLLFVVLDFHPSHLPDWSPANRGPPVGADRQMANLVLVLETTVKGPRHSSQRPTSGRLQKDQGATTSTGDPTPIFSPERAAPPGAQMTSPMTCDNAVRGRCD